MIANEFVVHLVGPRVAARSLVTQACVRCGVLIDRHERVNVAVGGGLLPQWQEGGEVITNRPERSDGQLGGGVMMEFDPSRWQDEGEWDQQTDSIWRRCG